MKKLVSLLSLVLTLAVSPLTALAAANDARIFQSDPTDTFQYINFVPAPAFGEFNIIAMDGSATTTPFGGKRIFGMKFGSELVVSNDTLTIPALPMANVSGLTAALAGKESTISTGTSSQYFRGDKTWATIPKADVGLGNVDNTADANKPVSTATQTALNGKMNVPGGTTAQYIRGDGTLATMPTASTLTFATSSRSLVTGTGATGFQVSASQNAMVNYAVQIGTTATIGGNSAGYVTLEIAPTNSATASDWYEIGARCRNDQAISLAIALQSVQTIGCNLSGMIPAGYYARLRSVTIGGSPSYTYISGHEVKM